jgi:hypothetical protein
LMWHSRLCFVLVIFCCSRFTAVHWLICLADNDSEGPSKFQYSCCYCCNVERWTLSRHSPLVENRCLHPAGLISWTARCNNNVV